MSRVTSIDQENEKIEFVKKAAARFKDSPELATFTEGEIEPGCFFAVRWGMHNRAILIFKLDDCFEPVIYGDVIEGKVK